MIVRNWATTIMNITRQTEHAVTDISDISLNICHTSW